MLKEKIRKRRERMGGEGDGEGKDGGWDQNRKDTETVK